MKSDSTHINRIDYIEFPAQNSQSLRANKEFYGAVFGWVYKDWGDEYADTQSSGVSSGISANTSPAPLAVIYSDDLETARTKVLSAKGEIIKEIFSFPGGRRFHFKDPAGNELAVWSDR